MIGILLGKVYGIVTVPRIVGDGSIHFLEPGIALFMAAS
jgi:hypothetical protein